MGHSEYKKRQELLRLLFLEGGAYSRKELAPVLGVKIDNLDKTLAKIRDLMTNAPKGVLVSERDRTIHTSLKYKYHETVSNFLSLLYQTGTAKEIQKFRYALLLKFLTSGSFTVQELCSKFDSLSSFPRVDVKSIQSYLKYLMSIGVIERIPSRPAFRYQLTPSLTDNLTSDEIVELLDYLTWCAHTSVLSAYGVASQLK